MASYGRNFDFRVPPDGRDRSGRHVVPSTGSELPIGAPVRVDINADPDSLLRQPLILATDGDDDDRPRGILVYEHVDYRGDDPVTTTYSMKGTVPLGAAAQMVYDPDIVVVLRNTVAQTFLGRPLAGRTMVAGFGATPTLAVGDFLAPGTGNDSAGYWAAVDQIADAWLVVVGLDHNRAEVEARML